jgi:hypothetical protein
LANPDASDELCVETARGEWLKNAEKFLNVNFKGWEKGNDKERTLDLRHPEAFINVNHPGSTSDKKGKSPRLII